MIRRLSVTVTAVLTLLLVATPAQAATTYASKVTARLTASSVTVGAKVSVTGTVSPGSRRTVYLQQYSGGRWRNLTRATSSSRGTYSVPVSTRTRGTLTLRVSATTAGRYRAANSAAVRLNVSGVTRISVSTLPPTAAAGSAQTLTGAVSGTQPLTRTIQLHKLAGTRWTVVATTTSRSNGTYSLTLPPAAGASSYRVYAPAASLATAATSVTRSITFTKATASITLGVTPSAVPYGTPVALTGKLAGGVPLTRAVTLQRYNGTTWVPVSTTTPTSSGAFTFALPTTTLGYAAYRVYAPEHLTAWPAGSVGRGLSVTATATTISTVNPPANVTAHTRFTVAGTVKGAPLNRVVTLETWKSPNGWTALATQTASPTGAFSFPLPTDTLGAFSYRATVPATATATAGASTHFTVTIDRVPTTVTATLTDPSAVYRTTTATLSGTLAGGVGMDRTVYLQRLLDDGTWAYVLKDTATSAGAFTFTMPTTTLGTFSYRVLALAGGTGAQATSVTRTFTVLGTPTPISLGATAPSVTPNTTVSLTGTVAGATPLSRELKLEVASTAGWAVVDTRTAATDGTFAFTLPTAAVGVATYRVTAAAIGTQAAGASASRDLAVVSSTSTITLAPAPTGALTGSEQTLTGTVTGSGALRPVQLQRASSGTWATIATATTDRDGEFALPLPTTVAGTSAYRVVAPATATAGQAVSAIVNVTVTTPSGPRAVTVSDDLHSLSAQPVSGGPQDTVYAATGLIDGPVDATPAGELAVTEWNLTTNTDEVWVSGSAFKRKAYTLAPDRCAAWVRLAPGATTLAVAEGTIVSGRCTTDVVLLVRTDTSAPVATLLADGTSPAAAAAFSPDGAQVAAAWLGDASGVRVVSTATGTVTSTQTAALSGLAGVRGLWWTPRGLLAGADRGSGYELSWTAGSSTTPVMSALTGTARSVAISGDGQRLVWQVDDASTPVVRTSALGYTATAPLGQDLAASPAAGVEPDTLTALPSGFTAVGAGDVQVSDPAATVVWSGRAVTWLR